MCLNVCENPAAFFICICGLRRCHWAAFLSGKLDCWIWPWCQVIRRIHFPCSYMTKGLECSTAASQRLSLTPWGCQQFCPYGPLHSSSNMFIIGGSKGNFSFQSSKVESCNMVYSWEWHPVMFLCLWSLLKGMDIPVHSAIFSWPEESEFYPHSREKDMERSIRVKIMGAVLEFAYYFSQSVVPWSYFIGF